MTTRSAPQPLVVGYPALGAPRRAPSHRAGVSTVDVTGYGYGTFTGTVLGRPARINPGDGPGYLTLLAYLPYDELDLVVLRNEEAPSVHAALADLSLPDLSSTRGRTAAQ